MWDDKSVVGTCARQQAKRYKKNGGVSIGEIGIKRQQEEEKKEETTRLTLRMTFFSSSSVHVA